MSDPDPLDPSLAALFRAEPNPGPPPDARARVLERLAVVLPAVPPALGGHAPTPVAAPLAHASAIGAKAMSVLAATFVAGGVLGGVAVTVLRSPATTRVVYVDRAAPTIASAPLPASSIAIALPAPATSATSATSDARPAPSSPAPSDLTAERDLVEDARGRLTSGDAAGAFARLQDHARRYPRGQLAEEREALAVEALVQTGRYDAARSRGAQLRARWPNSVFLPAVDATLGSIP